MKNWIFFPCENSNRNRRKKKKEKINGLHHLLVSEMEMFIANISGVVNVNASFLFWNDFEHVLKPKNPLKMINVSLQSSGISKPLLTIFSCFLSQSLSD